MMEKQDERRRRQEAIQEILASEEITTQKQLLNSLRRHGFHVAQATLSRDMQELEIFKAHGSGTYQVRARQLKDEMRAVDQRLRTILRESVQSYDQAQNLLVVKTLPGLANAAGAALDGMEIPGLVGTLAGDDTLFLAMRDVAAADRFREEIKTLLK